MTYYDILEVSQKASPEVVRMAYKALCKKYHPDICQGDKRVAEEKMKKINEAYDTLSDESKRRQYDYSLNSQRRYQQASYSEPRRESYYQSRRESYSPPRQESYAININDLLRKGFAALEGYNWIIADVLFSQVLNIEAKNAEAYLGKLMVELKVQTRERLKNCAYPFNDRENYKKAYALGDESLKNFLYKTIQYINKRNHDAECEKIYRDACDFMGWSKSIRDFEYVIAQLEKIRGYKDTAKKIERCYEKIAQIKSEQLAAQAAREKRIQEFKELFNSKIPSIFKTKLSLFKKIAIIVIPVLVVAIIAATVIPEIGRDNGVVEEGSDNVITEEQPTANSSSNDQPSPENTTHKNSNNTSGESSNVVQNNVSSSTTSNNTTHSNNSSSSDHSLNPYLIFESGEFRYQLLSDGTARITAYYGQKANITLPDKIDGYIITSVGGDQTNEISLFSFEENLKTITIPNSVTRIEKYAFSQSPSLIGVTIPNSVTNIGDYAFAYSNLNSIVLPSGITTINNHLFEGCSSLTTVTIPNTVRSIGERAFFACDSLTSITIPGSVESVGKGAFLQCKALSNVVIEEGVKKIEEGAFDYCGNIETITIPDSLEELSEDTFSYAYTNLRTVYFHSETQKEKYKDCFFLATQLIVQ